MRERLTTISHKLKKIISPRVRAIFGIVAVLFSLWFFARFVLAEKEANVFIFPSTVTSDGWQNGDASRDQDLSSGAELVDFSRENSSYVFFGRSLEEELTATSTPETEATATAPLDPSVVAPSVSGSDLVPAIVPVSSSSQTPTDETVSTSTSASVFTRLLEIARAWSEPQRVLALDLPTSTSGTVPDSGSADPLPIGSDVGSITPVPTPALVPVSGAGTFDALGISATGTDTTASTSSESVAPAVVGVPTAQSSDPYTVALCATLGHECHILEYEGFGLGGALAEHPLTGATLELSVAGRAAFSRDKYDRVLVRAYHEGRWEFLGEEEVRGELSNGKRGGYLHFDLSSLSNWNDLADLKIVVEYDRASEADASAYIDGLWINARYNNDAVNEASPEDIALTSSNVKSLLQERDAEARKARRDTLSLFGRIINFINSDDHADARLSVKTDQPIYHVLGDGEAYFNVTNDSDTPEVVRMQFHFPEQGATIASLSRFMHNVPYKTGEIAYDDIGYSCEGGWEATDTSGHYRCVQSTEVRHCDALNDDKTNCIVRGAQVGLKEGVAYRDGWQDVSLKQGSITDESSIFARAIDLLLGQLPTDAIPSTLAPVAHLGDSILIQPGQTMYFRAKLSVPLNTRGDFYVEAAAESGDYGLVHASWDGSWNYRMPIAINARDLKEDIDVPVHFTIDNAPLELWDHALPDGADVRFVDEEGTHELPYWLMSWDKVTRHAEAWVRLPKEGRTSSTTIYLYAGDEHASSRSDQYAPFHTVDPEARGVVMGGSQHDMTLHITALDEATRVRVNDTETELKKGESALFENIAPGVVVYADGPIAGAIENPGVSASYVPLGYAGETFLIPELSGDREIALASFTSDATHASLELADGAESVDPVFGSTVRHSVIAPGTVPLYASAPIVATLGAEEGDVGTILYPKTDQTLYALLSGPALVGVGSDNTDIVAVCSNAARKDFDGRRSGMTVKLDQCNSGLAGIADALRVSHITNPVSVLTQSAAGLSTAIPHDGFASVYTLTAEARSLSFVCAPEDGLVDIGVFDPDGGLIATSTCEGRGANPGKAFVDGGEGHVLPSGVVIRGDAPFMAFYTPTASLLGASVEPMPVLLSSPALSRVFGGGHVEVTEGTVEFIVPGEHRKLDTNDDGKEKEHVDTLLSKDREFSVHTDPAFHFKYKRQSNSLMQNVRDAFGVAPFSVTRVVMKHPLAGEIPVDYDIGYGDNNEWSLSLKQSHGEVRPGKYTLHIEIEEGGETYVDEFDFYWGVLAINYERSVYTPGEEVKISMGALSNNGNTICDADLRLWITDTTGKETSVPVSTSGKCNGNNVVDVPDYFATYQLAPDATGTYAVKLVRLDQDQNVASQVADSIEVRERVPYVIERTGPTRIYPLAHYPMHLRVRANEAFEGNIVERIPGDFVVIDRGNADLEWGNDAHDFMTATWPVKLAAGGVVDLEYTFDAPDRSPYLYLLGPAKMTTPDTEFVEARQWQIASDAAGKMMVFWDNGSSIPVGWTCVSCSGSDPFAFRLPVGSSTYGGLGGATTTTHTVSGIISTATSTAVAENTQNNLLLADNPHGHSVTPNVVAATTTPLSKTLRVIQSNSAGEPATLPAGVIAIFDVASSSLPSTWYRYSTMDGFYVMGSTTVGSTTGSNTHTHTVNGSTSPATGNYYRSRVGGTQVTPQPAASGHTHSFSTTTNPAVNNEPPYIEVLFARLTTSTSTIPNYVITMWDNTPPTGWINQSDPGQTFNGKFLKASTTYGTTGGSSSHTHVNMVGGAVGSASSQAPGRVPTFPVVVESAPGDHSHQYDLTDFTTDVHTPNYVEVIYAKRFSGVTLYDQNNHRWYTNVNANTVTDPWPQGSSDVAEGDPIDATTQPTIPTDVVRLRMSLNVSNATATPNSQAFKLQYVAAASGACSSALNWNDVAPIGSSTALWRGYNNASVVDGANLSATALITSNVAESYTEQNNSSSTPTQIPITQNGEWDWVIQDNAALATTNYCFRMVKSDGTPLDTYSDYPEVLTNNAPDVPTQSGPFDYEKVGTTTPDFYFVGTDPELNDLDYEVQIDTTATFTSPFLDKESSINPELFDNISNISNKAPFSSGDTIHFRPTTALTNGVTYWWRVRAKDSNASNTYGSWSAIRSFTVDTSVTISTWHQTRQIQFQNDTFTGATTTVLNDLQLISGSTSGNVYSPAIPFSLHTTGTVWGSFSWNKDETNGNVRFQVEYFTSTSSWALIPDADLPGNGATLGGTSVSLLTVDPTIYDTIRLKAVMTNIAGTPRVLDWTVAWGYNVATPTLFLPFDNAKVGTTTPSFEFLTTDPQRDDLRYEIQWSTTSSFTSSTTRNSQASSTAFTNIQNATDTDPFNTGDRIRFTPFGGDTLSPTTTYFWRVRAKDPAGANNFSFWSDVHSFTTDSTLVNSTWFQTHDDQFNGDSLTSMETFASNTLRVATSTSEAMVAYGSGTNQKPQYRIWDGVQWGTAGSALSASSTIQWVVLKASSLFGEYLMGTIGANKKAIFQVYKNGSWGNQFTLTSSVANVSRRGIAATYQTLSGNAIVAACDGDADPTYGIWNSTTSSWTATGTINFGTAANCEWLRLISSPISNEVIVLGRNTGNLYEAQVWNATTSTWGNAVNLGSMTETGHEGMSASYENSGNQAIIVASNANNASFIWKSWSGTAWTASATQAIADDFEWGNLKNPGFATDTMALCYENNLDDQYVIRWDGNAWVGNTSLTATGNTRNDNRSIDCEYDGATSTSRSNIVAVYSDTTNGRFNRFVATTTPWAWQTQGTVGGATPILNSATVETARTLGGVILSLFLDKTNKRYDFSFWNGSAWSTTQTIETSSSVTASPYAEPFMMAPKNPATQGTIVSQPISFADGNAPGWKQVSWSAQQPSGSSILVQVQYLNPSGSWVLIPNTDLPGNSTGTSSSPISIVNLDTTTYATIRLVANATCNVGVCPYLNDWSVIWAQGIDISGTAKAHDLTTNVTSGTVAVAVNGTLQAGKTGTIAGGQWTISNVTVFPGNTVEVYVSAAATSARAVNVTKYDGPGNLTGVSLNQQWLTIGTASTSDSSVSLTDMSRYDNSVSLNSDIFFDVDAGGDLNTCVSAAACSNAGIYVVSGNTFRPSTSTAKTINTFDLKLSGYMYGDTNTIKVGGDWTNTGGFTANTSTVLFNATTSTRSVNSTGAATSTFFNVTFGEAATQATWSLASSITATGTFAMNFGTTSPGANDLVLQGDLSIGASGTFLKGSATTTFSGSTNKTWTDSTASKQDMGRVVINGTAKTITLGSSVKATDVTIGADDTLNAGGANTLTTFGSWNNTGTFTAQTGTVNFAATSTGKTINQGTSNFYNVSFSGSGGAWSWQNTNATATNDVAMTAGTTTLPSGTLAVGGSFTNSGGAFLHNSGVIRFTATASGKSVSSGGSTWNDLIFVGSGGAWTMTDTNATTSGTVMIIAGTPTLPSGTFAIGTTFDVQSGAFSNGGGTLRMTSTTSARTIHLSGSSLSGFFIAGGSAFTIAEGNATATADVTIATGTLTFPTAGFTIGGNFAVQGTASFAAGTSTTYFAPTSGTKTVSPSTSSFVNVEVRPSTFATVNITTNATTTGSFILVSGSFTQSTSTTLAIGGTFTNQTGGASTTWTGSTLALNSGTSYAINSKTTGGDTYAILKLPAGTNVSMWNSSANTYQFTNTSSVYSQDDSGVDGSLFIGGNYARSTGADYWDYATDFDGTALGGSSRQVNVRFAPNATSTYTGSSTLEIIGSASASTTIDRATSGSYALSLSNAVLNAQYYQFRNMNATGLDLSGTTTITAMSFGDIEVAAAGGSGITIASTTVNRNTGLQIFNMRFATSTAIAAFNVTETGSASSSSFIRFKQHYGNIAGENSDNDPGGNPGYIRWDDSQFVISISGTVYSDAGVTTMGAPTCDNVTNNVRVKVNGQGSFAAPCNSANGTFTVPGVTFTGDTVMSVYLDTNGGKRAITVTKSASADLTGIKLYQDRVIVRHEDISPMTIADLNAYDAGNDTDIPYTAATSGPNTLSVNPETEFWVWTGKTFVPGGNITLNSGGSGNNWDGTFHVDNSATFTAQGTESHSVGGRFVLDAGATFTAASSTFTMTATTSGKVIIAVGNAITFWNLTLNGSGGNWSVNQAVNVGNDLLVTAGTLSGASPVAVAGANLSGNGTIAMTGGQFGFTNGGTFGGTSDWTFYDLRLGSTTVGTTTKSASSTITVTNVLTVAASHVLQAGTPSTWNLSGGGTPFVLNGTFDPQTTIFRYSATTSTTITATTYHRLFLAPSGSGGPTYTLASGAFITKNNLMIGDGVNSGTTTIDTNDPSFDVRGDLIIAATSTLVGSNTGSFNLFRSWVDLGKFVASSGTVNFVATTTGNTVFASTSPFAIVNFNSGTGGWTITANATSTGNLSLTAASVFTVASSTTLEVKGAFLNAVGGASTTWTGSTLYLNSGSSASINTKTTGADQYDFLQVGASTAIRMWNSVATTTTVAGTGSLYSQNHNAVGGALNIYGAYTRSSGNDYWDYDTDFDGATVTPRQVNVRFASGTSLTLSGTGVLEAIGTSTATTTLDVQSSGTFSYNVTGGSTTMQYFSVRNADANGLSFSGTPTVTGLSDGDFQLGITGGTMITVAGTVIDQNPLKIFMRNRFATSTGVSSGFNVKATGSAASAWRFNLHYGSLSGEAFDSDPGGDPGYLIWDDSAANITISGNVYADEGITPIGNPVCNGVTQNIRLKVQGAGTYTSACNNSTGAYSISNVIFNPGDTLTLYIDANSTTTAANVSLDPATNINNMHLYRDRVIVRHEGGTAMSIAAMNQYDYDQDTDIPFKATLGSPNTLSVFPGTTLIVWTSKVFAPAGNVTVHGNAFGVDRDGTVKLYATSTWSSTGSETHTIGGNFYAASGASVAPANSTFVFTATTSGKSVAASSSLTFYNLTFSGTSGTWDISGVGTTSNDISMTAGTTTLPSGVLAVGGSFDANGGKFLHNSGTIKFTSTASGKNIRSSGSIWNGLQFSGTGGGWTFLDTNATATADVIITAGTPTLPTGVLEVGRDFDNQSGALSAGSGTLRLTATSSGRILRANGSSLGSLFIANSGTFTLPDANATATGDVIFASGTSTLPTANFVVGGNFIATGTVSLGTSTLTMNPTSGTKLLVVGSSTLYNVNIAGSTFASVNVSASATATNAFTITSGSFTQASSTYLAVGGTFTNLLGGASTTWSGSLLSLYSGTNYSINTKSTGGDVYGIIRVGANTNIRSWNSSANAYQLLSGASLYSQNHGAVSGALNIYGAYTRVTGTDYWSYATDFDGTALGGSSRQAVVKFDAGASLSFTSGSVLQMIGIPGATTTVDRISTGSYGMTLNASYINASFYQFRNLNATGLNLTGTTTITSLSNGDFELAASGGSMITIASTTVDQNASTQIFTVRFATTTAINGANVTRIGTTTTAITFGSEYGNMATEGKDNDGNDACGSIRWTDSSCLISDQRSYRWRNDDGAEGAPASEWYDQNWSRRQRVRITNNSTSTITNAQVKMNISYDSDMQSNFNDLRFTDSSGTTSIPYWIESYVTSGSSTVWVKVPTLTASAVTDIFMYYGNGSVSSGSSGTSTFKFFDDFEDNNMTEYSGDTSLYTNSSSFNYERTYGLAASAGNTAAQNTNGIGQVSAGVGRDTTFRFFQYVDSTKSDEPCFLFAIQSPLSAHQNYAVCLTPFGADKVTISKNAAYNGRSDGGTQLATTSVTYSTGWYEASVDWLSNNQINVRVYDSTGALFATTSAVDSTYTTGGVGFTFWGQNGGWDIPEARAYISATPSVTFGLEQQDSGATWKAAENAALINQLINQNVRLRLLVRNSGAQLTGQNYRLQVAPKTGYANCESVPNQLSGGSYTDVTVNGSCGSSPACMAASSQFTDKSSTTQALSIPSGQTFTYGQIMKDSSNQTNALTLNSGEFTEVEYNFQMTAFATQDAYCFRVVNGSTAALDNYTKVAEMRILQAPALSNFSFNHNADITLIEGTTTTIYATSTVTDYNGYTDLVNASSTFYRSGLSSTTACTADNNNCYQIGTSSCSFINCAGNSCTVSCSAPMYYFADPTDFGSAFASENWKALIDVWDTSNTHDRASSTQEVITLKGLTVPTLIDYGSVVVGTTTGATDATTTVNNTGNTILNLLVSGSNMTAGSSTIPVDQQKYATSTFYYSSCSLCNILSTTTATYNLGVTKPTSTAAFFKDIYWGLNVPIGTAATTHNGSNVFLAN